MSLKKLVLASTLALTSGVALAGNLSYDYVQGGLIEFDEADGFDLEFSKELAPNWYTRINYMDIEADNFNADGDILRLNLGYKMPISSATDFVAEIGYEDIDAQAYGFSGSDSGYNALVGLRGMASGNLELGGYVQYSDVLESTDLTVEARYHFTPQFSIAAEIGNDEEADEHYGVNFRYSF